MDAPFALTSVAVPVLVLEVMLFLLYSFLVGEFDRFHIWLFIGAVAMLALSVIAVVRGASIGLALLVVAASPAIVVVGFETVGYRHQAAALERHEA